MVAYSKLSPIVVGKGVMLLMIKVNFIKRLMRGSLTEVGVSTILRLSIFWLSVEFIFGTLVIRNKQKYNQNQNRCHRKFYYLYFTYNYTKECSF